MRNSDIELLSKVGMALAIYLPIEEQDLLQDYKKFYERQKSRNDKEKQHYKENADYYRNYSKEWKQNNPEKQRQYGENYLKKKKEQER